MAALSSKLRSLAGGRVAFRCPGCHEMHQITVKREERSQGPLWGYNGDPQAPTFTPSILVTWSEPSDVPEEFDDTSKDKKMICHSFVTDGKIRFLGDCTHALKDRVVDLPDLDEEGAAE